jgi:hypothetical protein
VVGGGITGADDSDSAFEHRNIDVLEPVVYHPMFSLALGTAR